MNDELCMTMLRRMELQNILHNLGDGRIEVAKAQISGWIDALKEKEEILRR